MSGKILGFVYSLATETVGLDEQQKRELRGEEIYDLLLEIIEHGVSIAEIFHTDRANVYAYQPLQDLLEKYGITYSQGYKLGENNQAEGVNGTVQGYMVKDIIYNFVTKTFVK